MNPVSLAGRTILVTGASRGIGEALALHFAACGARVGLLARSAAAVETVAARIRAAGGEAAASACDVASFASVEAACGRLAGVLGAFDTLVNNAGVIAPIGRLGETDPAAWVENIAINLGGAYNVVRAVLADLLASGRGVILNLSSGAAARPLEGWSAYSAGKAGLLMLTASLDLEYGGQGLSVYGFRPGVVDTEMQGAIRASGINPVSKLPRESLASPVAVAEAAAWFVANAPAALRGKDTDIRDEAFRQIAGLAPLGSST
jgi:NAD(P)-dependent dehydrogenase (short-subunit alcohol dehydrogenase family)